MITKELTPEQVKDAEKLCQIIKATPANKRPLLVAMMSAYIDGIKQGMSLSNKQFKEVVARDGA